MEIEPHYPSLEDLIPPHLPTARELIAMSRADQEMRSRVGPPDMSGWDESVDVRNTARLKEIIDEIGWPTISKVGMEASSAAWLLAQHTPDPDFMKRCLELMKQVPEGDVRPVDVAYLEDRVRIMEDKPQLYGTQFCWGNNEWQLLPIEDPEHVDERRASVGLESLARSIERMNAEYNS